MTTETNQLPNFSKTENFQSTMSSLNYGHVMEQAARDYQREMLLKEEKEGDASRRRNNTGVVVNLNEDDDEALVERMQKKRLEELKNGTLCCARMMKRRDRCFYYHRYSLSLSLSRAIFFFLLLPHALLLFNIERCHLLTQICILLLLPLTQRKSSGSRWNG